MTETLQEKILRVEDAVIELGKVDVLLKLVTGQIEASPKVAEIQSVFFLLEELFSAKYEALKSACYGEV